jgi:L-ascorbate metabolism protein UlaG (beta-lactamase superfamily)
MEKITFLGHAGFKIESNGTTILIDVWKECPTFPSGEKIDKADYILVSHGHFDHLLSAPDLAKETGAKIVCIYDLMKWLEQQGIGEDKIIPMNKGGTVDLGSNWKITFVHAEHSSTIENELLAGGEAVGFVLHTPDNHRIYYGGDTAVFGDMKIISDIYSPDLAILPIGDNFTMGPLECAYALNNLLPTVKILIPMHYGTIPILTGTPKELNKLITRSDLDIKELSPGSTLEI